MASSNRHWPSMFKSKPCNPHHQWQAHDLISNSCNRSSSYSSVGGCEERSPEPKPRWNPKPEQIKILEAIFNSGMVNPPRDEIRKIRAQLQEYGQVGDANVFYWFQNRKSRSKHKLRHLQTSSKNHHQTLTAPPVSATPASSPSSSSDKSSPKSSAKTTLTSPNNFLDVTHSPTGSVNETYLNDLLAEPFFFPVQQPPPFFGFSELANVVQAAPEPAVGPCTSLLLSEIMNPEACKKDQEEMKMKAQLHLNYHNISTITDPIATKTTASTLSAVADTGTVPSLISNAEGAVLASVGVPARSTVFINDVAYEIGVGPFNVLEAFGEDAVLINSSGMPVLTNEWGVTLQSLQHGAFYYLVRTLSPFSL